MKAGISKIWISCPISVVQESLDRFKAYLELHFPQVDTWNRGSVYINSGLDSSDAVVFLLPGNEFGFNIELLPDRLKSELKRARDQKKKILIGYFKATTKEWAVYDSTFVKRPSYIGSSGKTCMNYYIQGIEDSTKQVLMASTKGKGDMISIRSTFKGTFDQRLLLAL